jgi:hypothetical protein
LEIPNLPAVQKYVFKTCIFFKVESIYARLPFCTDRIIGSHAIIVVQKYTLPEIIIIYPFNILQIIAQNHTKMQRHLFGKLQNFSQMRSIDTVLFKK